MFMIILLILFTENLIDGEEAEPDLRENRLHIQVWIGLGPGRYCSENVNLAL